MPVAGFKKASVAGDEPCHAARGEPSGGSYLTIIARSTRLPPSICRSCWCHPLLQHFLLKRELRRIFRSIFQSHRHYSASSRPGLGCLPVEDELRAVEPEHR